MTANGLTRRRWRPLSASTSKTVPPAPGTYTDSPTTTAWNTGSQPPLVPDLAVPVRNGVGAVGGRVGACLDGHEDVVAAEQGRLVVRLEAPATVGHLLLDEGIVGEVGPLPVEALALRVHEAPVLSVLAPLRPV